MGFNWTVVTSDGTSFEIVGASTTSDDSSKFKWILSYDTTTEAVVALVSSPLAFDEHYSVVWDSDNRSMLMQFYNKAMNLYFERTITLTDAGLYVMTASAKDQSGNILVSINGIGKKISELTPPKRRHTAKHLPEAGRSTKE